MDAQQRNTKDWYLGKDPMSFVSEDIINFIKNRAGKKILDFGCGLGGYSARLGQLGFKCTALDANENYVQIAKSIKVDAQLQKGDKIEFPDGHFDTVIMVEVIEHLDNLDSVLSEVKRVAKDNLIITCPNCTEEPLLTKAGLLFEHVLDADHKRFFTVSTLKETLKKYFSEVSVFEKEPVEPRIFNLLSRGSLINAILLNLYNLNVIKPKIFFRLYAEARKDPR